MKRMRIARIIYIVLVLAAYAVMAVGYGMRGEAWYDAMYYAFQAFLISYKHEGGGNLILYVGRVVCPLLTATGLFALLRSGLKVIADWWVSRLSNATAVYYDTEQMKLLAKGFCRPVLMGNKVNKRAKSHVLLFAQDVDNLTFLEKHAAEFKPGSKVYIRLEHIESKLLKESKVFHFNTNEIIARTYWQDRNLQRYLKDGKMNVKIAILGFDALGQNLLDYGLMNNVYSLDQSIEYHVWGDSLLYRNLMGDVAMMNRDTLTFHEGDWREALEQLKTFDRIIVSEEVKVEILQALLYLSSDAEIDFYNPEGVDLPKLYMGDKLTEFGMLRDILTEDMIKTDKLYRDAKKVNYNYTVMYDGSGKYTWESPNVEELMEEAWQALDGFTKGSNVACADYHKIRMLIMETLGWRSDTLSPAQMEMLAEMEHVRWSRYHYVNHWHYGDFEEMPEDGKGGRKLKNPAKRLHTGLILYEDLTEETKQKDRDAIQVMFEER